jgi:hypothetical protein
MSDSHASPFPAVNFGDRFVPGFASFEGLATLGHLRIRPSERVNLSPGSKYRFGLRGSKSGDSLFWAIR